MTSENSELNTNGRGAFSLYQVGSVVEQVF